MNDEVHDEQLIIIQYLILIHTAISRQVWWLRNLHLRVEGRTILEEGKDLNDTIINAAQTLLKTYYPNIGGFQNTLLGQRLQFKEQDPGVQSVQILHTGLQLHSISQVFSTDLDQKHLH